MIDQELCLDCGELHKNCTCVARGKKQFVALDIDMISEKLYRLLIKEFKHFHGEGYYDCWSITADKS